MADFEYCFAFVLSNEDHTPPRYEDEPDAPSLLDTCGPVHGADDRTAQDRVADQDALSRDELRASETNVPCLSG